MYKKILVFYDTWPKSNNAEKEILYRFEIACHNININFATINNEGFILKCNVKNYINININDINKNKIIAVISLHYESPKTTDHLTLSVLWNPIEFYNDETIIKQTNTDYFISSYSSIIDSFFSKYNKTFIGHLVPSCPEPLLNYSFDNFKLFYCGINWDKLHSVNSRKNVYEFLKLLDKKNLINIYGPKIFHCCNVWEGYNSYSGEISFDGISLIKKINELGICLILSSDYHKNNNIVSSRLYEGLAAGVPLICDENIFIKEIFEDNVFYVDLSDGNNLNKQVEKIEEYIHYIKNNKDDMKKKLDNCRKIFVEKFLLEKLLIELIENIGEKNYE